MLRRSKKQQIKNRPNSLPSSCVSPSRKHRLFISQKLVNTPQSNCVSYLSKSHNLNVSCGYCCLLARLWFLLVMFGAVVSMLDVGISEFVFCNCRSDSRPKKHLKSCSLSYNHTVVEKHNRSVVLFVKLFSFLSASRPMFCCRGVNFFGCPWRIG